MLTPHSQLHTLSQTHVRSQMLTPRRTVMSPPVRVRAERWQPSSLLVCFGAWLHGRSGPAPAAGPAHAELDADAAIGSSRTRRPAGRPGRGTGGRVRLAV